MTYKDLTISQWEQYHEYLKMNDNILRHQEIYKLLTGCDQTEIDGWTLEQFYSRYNTVTDFLLKPVPKVEIKPFTIEGHTFTPFLSYYEWQVWRMVSMSSAAASKSTNMALLIALGVYESGKEEKLNPKELRDREMLIRDHCDVATANSYSNFFLSNYLACVKITENYYKEGRVAISKTNGDGTVQSIVRQAERLIYCE